VPVAVRISSAESIRRIISSDALLSAIIDIFVVNNDGKPPVALGASGAVKYLPIANDADAIWSIKIIGLSQEEIREVSFALKALFPTIDIITSLSGLEGKIISLLTPESKQLIEEERKKKEEEARLAAFENAIQYARSLKNGLDGRDGIAGEAGPQGEKGDRGEPGPPGRDGKDGRDLLATDAELNDLKDVFVPDPGVGHVLMWDGASWVSRYLPQVYKYAGGGGGGISEPPDDGNFYVRRNGEWINLLDAISAINLDAGNFDPS